MQRFAEPLTNDEYHAADAFGSTDLKRVLRSPAHFLFEKKNPTPPTPAMQFGTLAHKAILEPDLYASSTIVAPEFSGTGCRQAKAEWLELNKDKQVITADQKVAIDGILRAINQSMTARALLHKGRAEQSFFCTDFESGLPIKARPDFLREDRVIVDVKTTVDANPATFGRTAANLMYALSAALYLDVCTEVTGNTYDRFILLAIEKDAPHGVGIYLLDDDAIALGRKQYRKALSILAECKASGRYPSYPDEIYTLQLPRWVYTE